MCHHFRVARSEKKSSPKKEEQSRRHAQPKKGEECESETLILERESNLPRVRLLLDCQIGQLVNTGQLVKVTSQLWSKLDEGLTPTKDGGTCLRRLSMFRKEVH